MSKKIVTCIIMLLIVSGCSTSGTFVVPDGAQLYLGDREKPVEVKENGVVTTRPFDWSAIGLPPVRGIPYKLVKGGETIKEGKLRTTFRPASIFWPPFAILYWPTGLNPNITYDLTDENKE